MRIKTIHIGIFLIAFVSLSSFAQTVSDELILDQNHSERPSYSDEAGREYNDASFYDHPDFGKLTFSAPYQKNVVEDLSKRTEFSRYYVDLDHPAYFYIEKSSKPLNILKDGDWIAIDPSLHPLNQDFYVSGEQHFRTGLDLLSKETSLYFKDEWINFNNIQLKKVHFDDSIELLDADWSTIEVNNFSAYITDVFPDIDMEIKFGEGIVKSNYIIHQNLNVKELHFIDEMQLSPNMDVLLSSQNPFGLEYAEFYNTETSVTEVIIQPARTFDNSTSHESWLSAFELNGHQLSVVCDSAHLNDFNVQYPITVDPTFIAVGPITNGGGVMGSLLSPASCTNNIVVNYPGGSEPWDVQYTWSVFSDFCAQFFVDFGVFVDCWMSEAQVWIESDCGGTSPAGAPGTVWTCPGCNNIGTWNPTVPFGSSGHQNMIQCYTPSCANQNMTFTINLNRTFCNSAYGYDDCVWANSYCQSLDDWSVTVQGRSVETLGNTATGNGTQNIFDADCAGTQDLDPTPLHGVGGYSYLWSTGATSPTITVPGTVSTYTVDVTDACGTTVTATFDIGCPLSAEEQYFTAEKSQMNTIQLKWNSLESTTSSFVVEKWLDDSWQTLAQVGSIENVSSYATIDEQTKAGINRYKLTHFSEETIKSELYTEFNIPLRVDIFPNPNNGEFTLVTDASEYSNFTAIITNLSGETIQVIELKEPSTYIAQDDLSPGCYLLKIISDESLLNTQKLIIREE